MVEGAVADVLEDVRPRAERRLAQPGGALAAHLGEAAVSRSIHWTMKWQPIPASALEPSGTWVELLCGQPGQK